MRNRATSFVIGALIGSVVTYFLTKKRMTDQFNDALLQMRKANKKREKKNEKKEETEKVQNEVVESRSKKLDQPDTIEDFVKDNPKYKRYNDIFKVVDGNEEDEKKFENLIRYESESQFDESTCEYYEYQYDGSKLINEEGAKIDTKTGVFAEIDLDDLYDHESVVFFHNKTLDIDYIIHMVDERIKGGDEDDGDDS